jgi:beta-glucosidase
LLAQMTLAEKAGTLFINGAVVNEDASLEPKPETPALGGRVAVTQMTRTADASFQSLADSRAQTVATWHNHLQRFAEQTRLGIPVTIASDPRNHFTHNIFCDGRHRLLAMVRNARLCRHR